MSTVCCVWLTRSRSRSQSQPQAAPGAKRSQTAPGSTSANNARPLVGGTITFSLAESAAPMNEAERVFREVAACGVEPVDRTVRLELGIKWEVGEAGAGGGLKAGEVMDASSLRIVSDIRMYRANLPRTHRP